MLCGDPSVKRERELRSYACSALVERGYSFEVSKKCGEGFSQVSEGASDMVNKSWDDVLLEERESNSRLRQQQRDQAERERRLVERLTQLKEQQQALQQGKTVDVVGRDGKIKALQVGAGNSRCRHAACYACHEALDVVPSTVPDVPEAVLKQDCPVCAGSTCWLEPAEQGAGIEAAGCQGRPFGRERQATCGVATASLFQRAGPPAAWLCCPR